MATLNNPGKKPELKWIRITQLYIDQKYQRSAKSKASLKNLAHIKINFSWRDCGALIVSYDAEKKYYAFIDGQHRLIAALERDDIPELPCVVIQDQSLKEQASSFVTVNTHRVKLNPLAAFHAAVGAGDADAVSLREILDEAKVDVPPLPMLMADCHPRQVQAVGTLLKMLGSYSKQQIVWALSIIPEAYGDMRGHMRAGIIKALTEFIKLHPDTIRARMVTVLEQIEVEVFEKDARSYVAIKGGSSDWSSAAMTAGTTSLDTSSTRLRLRRLTIGRSCHWLENLPILTRLPERYLTTRVQFPLASNPRPETRPPRTSSMIAALTEGVRRFQVATSSRSDASSQPICGTSWLDSPQLGSLKRVSA